MSRIPVVVIGAGPQGLAAAAHLMERGLTPLVLEAGAGPAAAVAEWAHVRLFSAWSELVDPAAARLLAATGWSAPAAGYPTGGEWIESYLAPLADALGDRVRYGTRVVGVSRRGRDRLVSAGRAEQPFTVHVQSDGGEESRLYAPRGDRRLRHLVAAEPGRRGRLPGTGRASRCRIRTADLPAADRSRGGAPGRAARGGGRQRALGDDRGGRSGRSGQEASGHPADLGAAPRSSRGHLRRRRC